jgi:hypothetical protein
MAPKAQNYFNVFGLDLASAKHNFGAHTLKLMLTNTAPSASNTVKGDITQLSAGGGYVTDGLTLVTASSSQSGGLYKCVLNDYNFTATGTVGPWRYAVIYNSSSASQPLICWYDYESEVTINSGETFLFDFDGAAGAIPIAFAA